MKEWTFESILRGVAREVSLGELGKWGDSKTQDVLVRATTAERPASTVESEE